jgi:hypothetical protein
MACVRRIFACNRDRVLTCRPAGAHLSCGFAHRASDEGGPFRLGDVKRQCFSRHPPRHASGDAGGGCRRPRDGVKRGKCLAFPMCLGFFVDFAFRPKLRWGARVFARDRGVGASIRGKLCARAIYGSTVGRRVRDGGALECERLRQQAERDAEALFDERLKSRVRGAWLYAR